ncbi:uncharacterized [Tachysurus ichikawai]
MKRRPGLDKVLMKIAVGVNVVLNKAALGFKVTASFQPCLIKPHPLCLVILLLESSPSFYSSRHRPLTRVDTVLLLDWSLSSSYSSGHCRPLTRVVTVVLLLESSPSSYSSRHRPPTRVVTVLLLESSMFSQSFTVFINL